MNFDFSILLDVDIFLLLRKKVKRNLHITFPTNSKMSKSFKLKRFDQISKNLMSNQHIFCFSKKFKNRVKSPTKRRSR